MAEPHAAPSPSSSGLGGRLTILEVGLASSLGTHAIGACAAARAGIVRPSPLPGRIALDPVTEKSEPLIGHPVSFLTRGFSGPGRVARLGGLALGDLLSRAALRPEDMSQTAVVLALGSGYHRNAAELIADAKAFTDELPPDAPEVAVTKEGVRTLAVARMFEMAGLPAPAVVELVFDDHAGFGQALHRASMLLADRRVRRCLVGGIDSYCDPETLDVLDELALVKGPGNPVGIPPGEGAAFVLLERSDASSTPTRRFEIANAAYLSGSSHLLSPTGLGGRKLAEAVGNALEAAAGTPCGLSIGTHNGANWCAVEWGETALALPEWSKTGRHWWHAISFGDTGAAAPAIATCMATQALTRGYAEGPKVLVWASGPTGSKTAFVVTSR